MRIITVPDKRLRRVAPEVDIVGESAWTQGALSRTIIALLDVMYANNGAGLAAPQVGLDARIIVVDGENGQRHAAKVMINPVVTEASKTQEVRVEGCLSAPGRRGPVSRSTEVEVCYRDRHWVQNRFRAAGWLARCIQHEIDHLDGVLFIDKLVAHP